MSKTETGLGVDQDLLERDHELAGLAALLERVIAGSGGAAILEGPAGIGKSHLLEAAVDLAREREIAVLWARGGELERDFSMGIVRQLFEPPIEALDAADRTAIFEGAASPAAVVIDPHYPRPTVQPRHGSDFLTTLHAIYWALSNLAGRQSLLLCVDDAHWCDTPSLAFLLYLIRRIEGLPVGLVLAERPGEPGASDTWRQLECETSVDRISPRPFSSGAMRVLIRRRLGEPGASFVAACQEATGGNPLLAHELIEALARRGVHPTDAEAHAVAELGPRSLALSTLLRLSALGTRAVSIARASAILDGRGDLRHVAVLSGVPASEAAEVIDSMVAVELLRPGKPIDLAHPILRRAVYEDLPLRERAKTHARAARLLADEGADPELVAGHLLRSEPAGDPAVVDRLRTAAASAVDRGAPHSAIAYLRRAMAEPPRGNWRRDLLWELGRAEALGGDEAATEHLRDARDMTLDVAERAEIARALAQALSTWNLGEESLAVLRASLDELGDRDPDLSIRLETEWMQRALMEAGTADAVGQRLPLLEELARGGTPTARGLFVLVAVALAYRGERLADVPLLVERGLDGGRLVVEETSDSPLLPQAVHALMLVDALDAADALAEELVVDARRRGSTTGYASALSARAHVALRRGHLIAAEEDFRAASVLAPPGLAARIPAYLATTLLERGETDEAIRIGHGIELPDRLRLTAYGAVILHARARMHLARGDTRNALADLRASAEAWTSIHFDPNALYPWRSWLALTLLPGAPEEARSVIEEELRLANGMGLPRRLGIATRVLARLEDNRRRIELLTDAVDLLERADARLEEARALADLGAAHRRANRLAEARDTLGSALEAAQECGATPLFEQVHAELLASGARPRRVARTGVAALTPTEVRVAELAAEGNSNPEIAQALFVTRNTIETHLRHIYAKLGINSRHQLRALLEKRSPAD